MSLARGVVLISTFMILVIGASLVGLSIWLFIQDFEFQYLTGNELIDYGILAIGLFVFLLGFVGFCGATFQKKYLLKFYLFLMIITLLAELALTAYVLFQIKAVESFMEKNWEKLNDKARIAVQNKLDCCGMGNITSTPVSSQDESCFESTGSRKTDCIQRLVKIIKEHEVIVGSSIGSLILMEIIVIVFSALYIKKLSKLNNIRKVRPAGRGGNPVENTRSRTLAGRVQSRHSMEGHHVRKIRVEEFEDYSDEEPNAGRSHVQRDGWARHSKRNDSKRR